jgi:uncharacterized protein (DUF302 family)
LTAAESLFRKLAAGAVEDHEVSDDDGLVTIPSAHSVPETIDRLVSAVTSRGMTVFARVDHAAGAAKLGLELRPTLLVIFGNATGGTPLMQDRQSVGIDLPVKALAWEDAAGAVWLTYNDPRWLAARHGLGGASAAAVATMEAGLAGLTAEAAGA